VDRLLRIDSSTIPESVPVVILAFEGLTVTVWVSSEPQRVANDLFDRFFLAENPELVVHLHPGVRRFCASHQLAQSCLGAGGLEEAS
jgi:hypothetical protein